MAISRETKAARLKELTEKLATAQSVVLVDYKGITVKQADEIRNKCRESNVTYKVVKNTIARLAMRENNMEDLADRFTGTTALAFSDEDPIAPAKVLSEVGKEIDKIKFKVGFLAGKLLDEADLKMLAKMPGKNELRAQLLSLLSASARNMVSVLAAGPRSMVTVLQAKADKGA